MLKALLPDAGMNIKGQMKSFGELLEVSGYARRPKDFDDLIRILDGEVRLITPTDPDGVEADSDSVSQTVSGQKYYQLTHDYLVHSLREWLTRKQKESSKGRAELALVDRAAVWNARPENRQLPLLVQWLQIWWHTDPKTWTEPQKELMARAKSYHLMNGLLFAALLAVITFGGSYIRSVVVKQRKDMATQLQEKENTTRAEGLVSALMKADIAQVPAILNEISAYRKWVDPLLRRRNLNAQDGTAEKLRLAIGLLPVDDSQKLYVAKQLPICDIDQFPVVRNALPATSRVTELLWQIALDEEEIPNRRFQSAAALAQYASKDERWQRISSFVGKHLTAVVSTVDLGRWISLLEPAGEHLIGPLNNIHATRNNSERERVSAASALSYYLKDSPNKMVEAILVSDQLDEFTPLIRALQPHAEAVRKRLIQIIQTRMPAEYDKPNRPLSDEVKQQQRDAYWKRQSLAAVSLVQLGHAVDVWPLLKLSPNPSLRSFTIDYLGKFRTDANVLATALEEESDVSIRRALIQSLGGLDPSVLATLDRTRIIEQLQRLYLDDPDPGVHGSASWALRQWGADLPPLPARVAMFDDQQRQRIVGLAAEFEELKEQRPDRQVAWEQAISKSQESQRDTLTGGLIAHYPFDETNDLSVRNAATGQTDGIINLGGPEWVPGVLGSALEFDPSESQLVCDEGFELDGDDQLTFACWFRHSSEQSQVLPLEQN